MIKWSYEKVEEILNKEGYDLLSDEYKNTHTHLKVRCPKGHISKILWTNFYTHNKRCRYCKGKQIYDLNDIVGKKFGRLKVTKYLGKYKKRDSSSRKRHFYSGICDCGNIKSDVSRDCLMQGKTMSCGCLGYENKVKHGKHNTRIYSIYRHMIGRCYNENEDCYKNYGGRGIKMCEEWLVDENGFMNFYNWALKNGYKDDLTIDRIDNDGDYDPVNCRWTTFSQQALNKRNNHYITINGKTQTIKEWSDESGLSQQTISSRVNRLGWNGKAILKPVNKNIKKG